MLILIAWEPWLERNYRIFTKKSESMGNIIQKIRPSIEAWRLAGATCLLSPFGDPP